MKNNSKYLWKNVEIVGGGFVTGIFFHPRQKNLIYARTDIGGAYRWDDKTRRWVPLLDFLEKKDWNLYGIESIGLDPDDPRKLYLAVGTYTNDWAGNGAILRSFDRGRSFQRTDLPFKNGGNEDGRGIGERLAVRGKTLFFGTRHEGLWRSDDFGGRWSRVESFPAGTRTDGIGVSLVLVHGRRVYASALKTLWASDDDGKTWSALAGQPQGQIIHHGMFDRAGMLYLTYSNGPGPNGVSDGAVWKWHEPSGVWTEITPEKPGNFGYAGLALDPTRPGTVIVSSLDRWARGDTLWRTHDGGKTWQNLKESARRDVGTVDWLKWGRPEAELGHWIGSVALDPFRPGHALYGTGATIWGTDDLEKPTSHWSVRAHGLEETATLDLASLPAGAPLVSAMGDIGGFRHDDLTKPPLPGRALSPMFNTTNHLDFAELRPETMVASGNAKLHGALSTDGGSSWKLFASEPAGTRGSGDIALSSDGKTILWAPQGASLSRSTDLGATWTPCEGAPGGVRVAADRYLAPNLWALDGTTGTVFLSTDSGQSFSKAGIVPADGNGSIVTPFRTPHNAWVCTGGGLFHRDASGEVFRRIPGVDSARALGFGAPRPGVRYPTLFLNGTVGGQDGIWRSDDVASTWVRLDDPAHRFGTSNVICGDPRVWGRVYLGTNGRGILYADPVMSEKPSRTPAETR